MLLSALMHTGHCCFSPLCFACSQVLSQSLSILAFLQRSSPLLYHAALQEFLLCTERYVDSLIDGTTPVATAAAASANHASQGRAGSLAEWSSAQWRRRLSISLSDYSELCKQWRRRRPTN